MAQERGRKRSKKMTREQAGRKGGQARPKNQAQNPDFSRNLSDMDSDEMFTEEEYLGKKDGEARDKSEQTDEER